MKSTLFTLVAVALLGPWPSTAAAGETVQFSSLVEGSPGVPGDGVIVRDDGEFPFFDIQPGFSLRGVTNGITISVFPGVPIFHLPNTGNFNIGLQISFGVEGKLTQCNIGSTVLDVLTPTVNGVQGIAGIFSQSRLSDLVDQVRRPPPPGCEAVSLDQFFIHSILMHIPFGDDHIHQVDALAIGIGENVFPTKDTLTERPALSCAAPNVSARMSIPNPNCQQMWAYHIYRSLAVKWFGAEYDMIDAKRNKALTEHRFRSNVLTMAFAIHSVFTGSSAVLTRGQLMYVKTHLNLPKVFFAFVPDSNIGVSFSKELADFIMTSLEVGVTGQTPAPAIKKLLKLFSDVWALTQELKLNIMINSLIVAREYLDEYYKFGGDEFHIASQSRLPSGAITKQKLEEFANKLGYKDIGGRGTPFLSDYSMVNTLNIIQTFRKDVVAPVVDFCMEPSSACNSESNQTDPPGQVSNGLPPKPKAKYKKEQEAASTTNSKAKKEVPTGCNKESSTLELNTGRAQGVLKKYGVGKDGC